MNFKQGKNYYSVSGALKPVIGLNFICVCVFVCLCICVFVFVYLCVYVFVYLCICKKPVILLCADACHRFDIYFPCWSVFLRPDRANFWLVQAQPTVYIALSIFYPFCKSGLLWYFCKSKISQNFLNCFSRGKIFPNINNFSKSHSVCKFHQKFGDTSFFFWQIENARDWVFTIELFCLSLNGQCL